MLGTATIVFDGNSLTRGDVQPGPNYPTQVISQLQSPPGIQWVNLGVDGGTTQDMIARASVADSYFTPGRLNAIVVWEIRNDIVNLGNPADQALARWFSYCQARRAKGWKVFSLTVLPSNYVGDPPGWEDTRTAVNATLRAQAPTYCDFVVDVGALPTIGQASSPQSSVYYVADHVHLTSTGYAEVAAAVVAQLLAAFPQTSSFAPASIVLPSDLASILVAGTDLDTGLPANVTLRDLGAEATVSTLRRQLDLATPGTPTYTMLQAQAFALAVPRAPLGVQRAPFTR